MRYRLKPTEVEAIQFTGYNHEEVALFIDKTGATVDLDTVTISLTIFLATEQQVFKTMYVRQSDWVLILADGKVSSTSNELFEQMYEHVEN